MSKLLNVPIRAIDANPFRCLAEYPWIEPKIEALQRSIADVGFWEGVICRKVGDRFQLAFGHHRIEAAKREGLTSLRLVIRDLTDEQMLQFMGRENGEDYKSDFNIMLNTWDGAVEYLSGTGSGTTDVDVAKMLGWMERRPDRKSPRMNHVAVACANARKLSDSGHLSKEDLADIPVSAAEKLVTATTNSLKRIDKNAEGFGHTAEQVASAKETVVKAAKTTASKVRKGKIASNDVAKEVEKQTYKHAATPKQPSIPDFSGFVKTLSDSLYKILNEDANQTKIEAIIKAASSLQSPEHKVGLERIMYDLSSLSGRASAAAKLIAKIMDSKPVTDINQPKRLGVVK